MAREVTLERRQIVPRTVDETFAFFSSPANLEALTPGWLRFRIVSAPARLEAGSRLRYRLRLFGVPVRWLTEITAWHPPRAFTDLQLAGPYPLWEHSHRFTAAEGGTEVYDVVGIQEGLRPGQRVSVVAHRLDGTDVRFDALARLDSEIDVEYYRNGGILHTVLRKMARGEM